MAGEGFEYIRDWDAERTRKGFWHSFELPDGTLIEGVTKLEALKKRLAQFPIPADLTGQRALDIGCWDGWYSFELERRGAQVVAIDNWDNPLFRQMHAAYGSHVEYRQLDMYELTPERVGRFDIVLFMGVLYHLKHPLLALERVCALTTGLAAVDSFVLTEKHFAPDLLARPILEFYETDEMGGQTDNWFGPSVPALLAMCRVAGFARVELQSVSDFGAGVACYRKWKEPHTAGEAPVLHSALRMITFGLNFRSDQDEYICTWLDTDLELTRDNVQPEVSGFGARPVSVTRLGDRLWQVNFKLPPLTRSGWHEVRIRLDGGPPSNPQLIAVDMPLSVEWVRLGNVCDGVTWKAGELDTTKGMALSFWIEGLPENADLNNVKATLGDQPLRMLYLQPASQGESTAAASRQANAALTAPLPAGPWPLVVRVGDKIAGESTVEVKI